MMITPGLGRWLLAAVTALTWSPSPAQSGDATTATASARSGARPNVILILTDDMGQADLSCVAPQPLTVRTPNIDRLASEGVTLTRFYVSAPICSPTRASILTGMNAPETQLTTFLQTRQGNAAADQNDYLDPALAHLPKSFQAAGYATAHVGKWHLGGGRDVRNAPSIARYGYEEFWSTWESPSPDPKLGSHVPSWSKNKPKTQLERWQTTAYMVDRTLEFLDRQTTRPSFITLWPEDLHTPFVPRPALRRKHGGKPDSDRSLENFLAVLEEYDRQIGRLLDGLRERGLEENTLVIFTGDNGPNPDFQGLRTGGLRGKKGTLYEGGIREPLIARLPGRIPAGVRDDTTVMGSIDLLPTLAALTGVKIVPEARGRMVGEDLSRALLGEPVRRRHPLRFEFGRNRPARPRNPGRSPQLAILDGDFKVLVNRDGSDVQAYDLAQDPRETTNVADRHTSRVEALKKQVLDWSRTLPHRTHPAPAAP